MENVSMSSKFLEKNNGKKEILLVEGLEASLVFDLSVVTVVS